MDAAGCLFLVVRDVSFFRHSGPEPGSPAGARLRDGKSPFSPRTWAGWMPDQVRH